MDWKSIGIFALAMSVIAQIVHTLEAMLTMGFYLDPAYFPLWSKIMMPAAGAPPPEFMLLSFLFSLIAWALFGFAFMSLGSAIREKDQVRKGLAFGSMIFLVAGLPMTMTMYLLISLPAGLLVSWMASGLVLYLVAGVIAAKIIK